MSYLFSTESQRAEMLQAIGVASLQELLQQVPAELQLNRPLNLPPALTELELQTHVSQLAARNHPGTICFMGGGAYDHFIPAVVDELAGRGEFYTAYTPYQPEASQGSLQAFFEYQSLICQLTGMDVSNASLYEGGTAVSEAVLMAARATGRHDKIVLVESVNPQYRAVVETYARGLRSEIVTIPAPLGTADLDQARQLIDSKTACVVIQQPNYFGCLEQVEELAALAKQQGALTIVSFDPLSLGILKRPGDYGADIAVAEGQSLGVPLQYGGPYLGILACRQEFVRKLPGRLITKTTDRDGNDCYVLGLQTREQHIRRDKATSNICTNQGLLALRATIYLSLLGRLGLREVSELCLQKAHYAADQLTNIPGIKLMFHSPYFKEFTLQVDGGAARVVDKARQAGFAVGPFLSALPASSTLSSLQREQGLLVAVTEARSRQQIDQLVALLRN